MTISYSKLWTLLADSGISKAELRKRVGVAPNTMTRLKKDKEVKLSVLYKICETFDVGIGDVMEFLPDRVDSNY